MPYKTLDPTLATFVGSSGLAGPSEESGETLSTYRTELGLQLGNRDDITTPRLNRWINQAYIHLASMLDLPRLTDVLEFDTEVDQDLYQTEPNIAWVESASLHSSAAMENDGGPLGEKPLRSWRAMPEVTGDPTFYTLHGSDLIILWPVPDEVRRLVFDIHIKPAPLEDDNDSTILGPEWDESMLQFARAKAFSGLLEFTLAAACLNEAVANLRSRSSDKAERESRQLGGMRPVKTERDLYRHSGARVRPL